MPRGGHGYTHFSHSPVIEKTPGLNDAFDGGWSLEILRHEIIYVDLHVRISLDL